MYHFDLFEDSITIHNMAELSAKALDNLDEAINRCNLKRSYNTITGSEYDFYKFLQLISDITYCLI